jgi:hypothetical protein
VALNRADLILGLAVVFMITAAAATALLFEPMRSFLVQANARGFVATLFAGWVAILLASLGGAIKITSARQSLISLLSSEIKAIQFGLQKMDMFEFWTDLFQHPQKGAVGFADAPREERYFEIFHKVGDNIGNLHPSVAEAIVRFYTYLKMSRDAASALKTWEKQRPRDSARANQVCNELAYLIDVVGFSCAMDDGNKSEHFRDIPSENYAGSDLRSIFHPAIGRALGSFEPVWLGDATGRGAEPSA